MITKRDNPNLNAAFRDFKQILYNEIGTLIVKADVPVVDCKKTIKFDGLLTIYYQSREYIAHSITFVNNNKPEPDSYSEILLNLEVYKTPLQIEAIFLDEMLKVYNTLNLQLNGE